MRRRQDKDKSKEPGQIWEVHLFQIATKRKEQMHMAKTKIIQSSTLIKTQETWINWTSTVILSWISIKKFQTFTKLHQ